MKGATPKPARGTDAPPSFLGRLRQRLNRGDSRLAAGLGDLFRGREFDAAVLEERETRLITADVGVAASERMLANLKGPVARRELTDLAALTRALEASITEILAPCARPLVIDAAQRPFVILVAGVNGSGKTTTIGNLARRIAAGGSSVLLAVGDTSIRAAMTQLKCRA